MISRYRPALAVALSALLLQFCGSSPTDTAGSETTNGLTVASLSDGVDGTAEAGCTVALFSLDYLPHTGSGYADSQVVGTDGAFAFTDLEAGYYRVMAFAADGGLGAVVDSIAVPVNRVPADTAALDSLRGIHGVVTLDSVPQPNSLVYIAGTPFYDSTATDGTYLLDNIPMGQYRVSVAYSPTYGDPLYSDSADVTLSTWDTRTFVSFELSEAP